MIWFLTVLPVATCRAILSVYLLARAGFFGKAPERNPLYEAARWPLPLDPEEARRSRRMAVTFVAIIAITLAVGLLYGWRP